MIIPILALVKLLPLATTLLTGLLLSYPTTTNMVVYSGFKTFNTRFIHLRHKLGHDIITENNNDASKLLYPIDVWHKSCPPDSKFSCPADSPSTIPATLETVQRKLYLFISIFVISTYLSDEYTDQRQAFSETEVHSKCVEVRLNIVVDTCFL